VSECCCPPAARTSRAACPSCLQQASAVETTTVKALLTSSGLARLTHGAFYFCANPDCDAVYFSDDRQVFRTGDVRATVWQKEPAGARTICYCFDENEADIRREIQTHGRTLAIDRVRRHISDRRCACDVRNPRGACCLGELAGIVRRLQASEEPVR
jgi:Zinc binding domain